jgi:beta-galactosidase
MKSCSSRCHALLAASIAAVVLQTGTLLAADRERISIDDDWRFIKGDPAEQTANLTLLQVRAGGRGAAATSASQPAVNNTLWPYILASSNDFIKDPAKKVARPDIPFPTNGIPYAGPAFNDGAWRRLNLPHDFGIEGDFLAPGTPGSNGAMGRLPCFGQAWYRKHLALPASDAGRQIYLDMDGAMSFAIVFVNGQLVGGWPYGYSSWRLDLTPYVKPGGDNTIAIRLDNPPNSSRWYPGGGIYRNVWLTKTAPVHVGQWGTYITTPEVTATSASIKLKVTVDNHSKADAGVSVATQIFLANKEGKPTGAIVASIPAVNTNVKAGSSAAVDIQGTVANPKLWSPTTPNRYVAVTTVSQNGTVLDTYETPFGIRTLKHDPNAGLLVNGEHVRINGVCDHHDLGALGAAVNVRALQRQLEILHDMGCNAIRTSHNPPAPELMELADRMGFMVMDELFDTWGSTKTPNDYGGRNLFNAWHEQDSRMLVRRDRNHPSVILWSVGNEISEQGQGSSSAIAKELCDIVHSEDPTRPTTAACSNAAAMINGFNTLLDAMGFNYKPDNYLRFHTQTPNQFFYSSESASERSSRGEYFILPAQGPGADTPAAVLAALRSQDEATHQVSSYDLLDAGRVGLAAHEHEFFGQDHSPAVAGEFVWTGFDYLGEPTPWGRATDPSRSSYFGIIDLAGFPKDRYYSYQARWRPEFPMAHILPHWNWPDRVGQIVPVHVYTSGDEAELFLNGKSLGRKKKIFEGEPNQPNGQPFMVGGLQLNGQVAYRIRWDDVVYQPGELKVVAYKNGKEWATDTVKTSGPAARLALRPDRATIAGDGLDLSFVTLTVQDKDGLMVPRAKNPITFDISGPGEIVATDNGDAADLVGFTSHERKAFNGLALAIVKAKRGQSGAITLTAKSDGLTTTAITINLK